MINQMPNIIEKVLRRSGITYSITSRAERFIKQDAAMFCLGSGSINILITWITLNITCNNSQVLGNNENSQHLQRHWRNNLQGRHS